ncbi:hypothetical protein JCM3770_000463 [Rhodotorula araucariae]
MLKFFGGVTTAPDQTTPKASDQRNPFDFFTPARKGSTTAPNSGGASAQGSVPGSSAGTPSGGVTPALRASLSTQSIPTAARGGVDPPATPGGTGASTPQTPGGARSQPTTGASF